MKINFNFDMSIDEVIEHARTDMEFCENQVEFLKLEGCTLSDTATTQIYESIRYNKSIVALLEDLKMLRLSSCRINMQERLQLVENGYNKAIDDFVNECICCEHLTFEQEHIERIQSIAEQLKAGRSNE